MPGHSGKHSNIYQTLKALDPKTTAAFAAAAGQAMGWEPGNVAVFCQLIRADPKEIDNIQRTMHLLRERGVPEDHWLPDIGAA